MTTYQIPDGTQIESFFNADASTSLICPACGHLIPHVQPAQLTPDAVTGAAAWIDCACMDGRGQSRFNVALRDCPCYLRFRVAPSGAGNRYNVMGVDYAVMEERRRAHAALEHAEQNVATLDASPENWKIEPGGILSPDGSFMVTEFSIVPSEPAPPVAPVKRRRQK